jgi:hypothetical protein
MPNKYLITLWEKQFDWDGLYEEFKILGQYESLVEAVIDFPPLIEQVLSEAIERGAQDKVVWQEFEIDYEQLNQDHRDYFQGLGLAEGIPEEVYNNLDFVKRYFHLPNRYNYVIASSL